MFSLLDEYYKYKSKTCNYECNDCELGVLKNHGQHSCSCAIDLIMHTIDDELPAETDFDKLVALCLEVSLKNLESSNKNA